MQTVVIARVKADLLLTLLLALGQAAVIARVMAGALIARVIARVEAARDYCSRQGFLIARVIARAMAGGGFKMVGFTPPNHLKTAAWEAGA
jgi:hypothetical protein